MSGIRWHKRRPPVSAGVRYDEDGRLRIRPVATAPDGVRHDSWLIATQQPADHSATARAAAEGAAIMERAAIQQAIREGRSRESVEHQKCWQYASALRDSRDTRPGTEAAWLVRSAHWRPTFGNMLLLAVTTRGVREWWGELTAKGLSPGFTNAILGDVAAFMRQAHIEGLVPRDPVASALLQRVRDDRPSKVHRLDGEALVPVYAWVAAHDLRGWFVFTLMLATGMRPAEIIGERNGAYPPLRWDDVADGTIRVAGNRSKNRMEREIPISAFVAELLAAWRRISVGDLVVEVKYARLGELWRRGMRACDLDPRRVTEGGDGTLYSIRGIVESVLDRGGVADVVADSLTGHKTRVGTTAVKRAYDAPWEAERRRAVEVLGEYARQWCGGPGTPFGVGKSMGTNPKRASNYVDAAGSTSTE